MPPNRADSCTYDERFATIFADHLEVTVADKPEMTSVLTYY